MKRTSLLCALLMLGSGTLAQGVVYTGAMDNRTGFPFIPGLTAQSRAWISGGDPAGGVRLEWRVDNETNAPHWTYSYRLVRGSNRNKGFAFFDIETAADFTAADIVSRQTVSATDGTGAPIPAGLSAVTISDPADFSAVHAFSSAGITTETNSLTVLSKGELSHYSGDPGRAAAGQGGGTSSVTASVGPVAHPFRGIRVTFPGSFATLANLGYDACEWEFSIAADRVPMWGDVFAWGDQTTLSPYWYANFYNNHIDDPARLTLAPVDSPSGADPYQGWVLVPGPLPGVLATNPAAGADAVPVGEPVSAVFSGEMDAASITAASFSLNDGTAAVPGAVSYHQAGQSASFTPAAQFLPGTSYTATITGVKDLAGNTMADRVWSFVTGGADVEPPSVTTTFPGAGSAFVATTSVFTASFSEEVAPVTVNPGNFTVTGNSGPVAGTVGYSQATRSASFIPNAPLANNASYTATLGTGVTDLAGNHLAAPVSWSITTIPRETVLPTASATVPAARSINVAINTPISAVFSEPMDPDSINAASFTVAGLTGTVSYDDPSRTASFTPDAPLAFSTVYRPAISTAVRDLAGNPLPLAVAFSFTTAAPDSTPPTVTAVTPFDGLSGVPATASISAAFSEPVDPLSIGAASFTVTGQSFAAEAPFAVAGTVTLSSGSLSLPSAVFTPAAPLPLGSVYTATLSTSVKDLAGNHLVAPRTWSFTTAPDGILIPGGSTVSVGDALEAMRIAVGQRPATQQDRNHCDVAPLGADGKPRPDGTIDLRDALLILRKVVGLADF